MFQVFLDTKNKTFPKLKRFIQFRLMNLNAIRFIFAYNGFM